MGNQKGIAPVLLLIGILILGFVGGVYYFWTQSKIQPTTEIKKQLPPPTPTQSPGTSNTYSSSKLKFSFTYPTDYSLENEAVDKVTFSGIFNPGEQKISEELTVNFNYTIDSQSLIGCQNAKFNPDTITTCLDGEIVTKNFNGTNFRLFHIMKVSGNSQGESLYVAQPVDNPKIEFIHKILSGGVEQRMNQILSTFKFTN